MKKWRLLPVLIVIITVVVLIFAFLLQEISKIKEKTIQQPNEHTQSSKKPESNPKTSQPTQPPILDNELALINGVIQPAVDNRFIELPMNYSSKNIYLQKSVQAAVIKLIDAAQADGVNLHVISGFRSYKEQLAIWQRKWDSGEGLDDVTRVNKILKFSSMPGISRHHWGTDVDFNSVELAYWQNENGLKTQKWLRQNAPHFGFCEPYSGKSEGARSGGYEDEAWHWSYVSTARPLQTLRSEHLNEVLHQPLSGQNVVQQMPERIARYVNSVSTTCN